MTTEILREPIIRNNVKSRQIGSKNLPWFRRWFDTSHYQKLYAYRDEKEARAFMDALLQYLNPEPGAQMIDVGCGMGRHSKYLASKGFHVAGIDLSPSQVAEARKYETDHLRFSRHDMRQPFGYNQFDYALNLFTSFGYFNTLHEHQLVINNFSRSLKSEGILVMDYLNVPYTEENLVTGEKKVIDGVVYDIERWMSDSHFYKKISINDENLELSCEYSEQVAKFMLDDFNEMFSGNQLKLVKMFGDYSLNSYDPENSPRLIMIAKKV